MEIYIYPACGPRSLTPRNRAAWQRIQSGDKLAAITPPTIPVHLQPGVDWHSLWTWLTLTLHISYAGLPASASC